VTDRPEPDLAIPRWRDATWLAEVESWVTTELDSAGIVRTGAPEQPRAYPWSTVLRFPTDRGPVWFKANARGMHHEAALYEVLRRRSPRHVLEPLALDPRRGWLLLPDGGRTMRDVEGAGTDLSAWERMLLEHADMQRELTPWVEEVLDAGVPDARPHLLPRIRAALLGDRDLCRVGREGGLTEEDHARLVAAAPVFAEACAALAAPRPAYLPRCSTMTCMTTTCSCPRTRAPHCSCSTGATRWSGTRSACCSST